MKFSSTLLLVSGVASAANLAVRDSDSSTGLVVQVDGEETIVLSTVTATLASCSEEGCETNVATVAHTVSGSETVEEHTVKSTAHVTSTSKAEATTSKSHSDECSTIISSVHHNSTVSKNSTGTNSSTSPLPEFTNGASTFYARAGPMIFGAIIGATALLIL